MTARRRRAQPARLAGLRGRLVAILVLAAVWVLLWGEISWANVIGGVLVASFAVIVFPLAPLDLQGRVHPLGILLFVLYFLRDLVWSSVQVAVAAFLPRDSLQNAIIAVPLRIHSDLNIALTSIAVTLVPGSVVMEANRETGVLFVHVLRVRDHAHLERLRRSVLEVEARVVRAVGSPAERRRLEWHSAHDGGGARQPVGAKQRSRKR